MKQFRITLLAVLSTCYSFAQVGIGTTSPNTTLDVRGSLATNSRSFSTTSESVQSTDFALLFTGSSACTLTLPDATMCVGRIIHIKNTKTGTVPVLTIATTASQTIDGLSNWLLDDPNESVNVVSNGSNWLIMGQTLPSGSGTSWTQGGNTVGSIKKLGTIDNYDLPFITNNSERMRLTSTGLGIGVTGPSEKLDVAGNIHLSGTDRAIFFDATMDPYAGMKLVTRANETTELMLFAGNDVAGTYGADRIRLASHEIHFATASSGTGINSGDATSFYSNTTSVPTRMIINENGDVGIGSTTFNASYPEQLLVDAGSTGNTNFQNVIVGKGNTNSYAQLNIQNTNSGTGASSDVVATADNGNESVNYIDIGINSSTYSGGTITGGANNAYLYATGNDFVVGNATASRNLIFFTGGTATGNERMRITSGGSVGVGTITVNSTLDVNGSSGSAITTTSGNITLDATNYTVIITGGTPTVTLPSAASSTRRMYVIVNQTGSSRTISAYKDFTGASVTAIATNSSITIQSDGSSWYRIR